MNLLSSTIKRHRVFKLIFVPVLVFSLCAQLAVVWAQIKDIRNGYFDFVLYYSAARIVMDGKGSQLYNLELQREYQKELRGGSQERDLPFNHLPYELLAYAIPAKLSFAFGHLLWAMINIALLAIVLIRIFPFVEPKHRILYALMLLAYFPTLTTLKMGQDSIITTFLLVETFVNLKHKRHAIAGGVLALGLYKPQFVLPLIGILLLHRQWSSILGFLLVGVLIIASSLALVKLDGFIGLFSLWTPMIHRGNVVWPELMTNLRGLVYVALDLGGLTAATNVLVLGASIVVYVLTLRLWTRGADDLFDLRFSLAIIMTALVSFHLYSYDGTFLAIPLIIVLDQLLKNSDSYSLRHWLFLTVLFASFIPLLPNLLLSTAMLAWWALPLPVLFCAVAIEISRRSSLHRS